MPLKIGIVGLSQSGKTTLFRILTRARGRDSGSSRPETHLGVVSVPDHRLDRLSEMFQPRKTIFASVEYSDTAGSVIDVVRSGTQSAALREVQALALVVRAFGGDADLAAVQRDIENVELELILSDLAVAEKRLERVEKDFKKQNSPALAQELEALKLCNEALEKQLPLRELTLSPQQERVVRGFTFLSAKPMLVIVNLDEKDAAQADTAEGFSGATGIKQRPKTAVTAVCGKVESELVELSAAESAEFMESFGLKESAISRVIRSSYRLLGLISFFTVGEDECRAWTIRAGSTAWEAAGEIHSDIQKGFIRAEVISYGDLIECGGLAEGRNRGRLRLEGKEYVVKDGDIVHFRHSS